MIDTARQLAVKILLEVYMQDAYANVALARNLRQVELTAQDRRFVTELVYGTVKAGATLDWILKRYVNRPFKKIEPRLLAILRLGLYQLFYLDKVPASAACNTAVELAKKGGHRGSAGFVNAVLRTAVREPERAEFPTGKGHATEHLALASQHPQWLVKHWVKTLGFAEAEQLCAADNTEAPLCLRTNTLRNTPTELAAVLNAAGVEFTPSAWAPEGFVVTAHGALDQLAPLQDGRCQVQDESSMLVAHVVAPQPGECVIDCCAAPGGKTTHLAQLMHNQGRIIAGDIYEHKLARIQENADRLGISIIEPVLVDAREIGTRYAGQADRVLVDAPCSGLGVLRRKPDARWHKSLQELQELPPLQSAILASAAQAVKPGGVLVYSTCTIERAENQAVVESFLQQHAMFTLEQTGSFLPLKSVHAAEQLVQLYPHRDGTDGFFIARLRRQK